LTDSQTIDVNTGIGFLDHVHLSSPNMADLDRCFTHSPNIQDGLYAFIVKEIYTFATTIALRILLLRWAWPSKKHSDPSRV